MPSRRVIPEVRDPLLVTAVVGIAGLTVVVVADLVATGGIDPSLLALVVSVFGPLVPALLIRSGTNRP